MTCCLSLLIPPPFPYVFMGRLSQRRHSSCPMTDSESVIVLTLRRQTSHVNKSATSTPAPFVSFPKQNNFKHLFKHTLKPHAAAAYINCFHPFKYINFIINMLVSTALFAFTTIVSGAALPVAKRAAVTDAEVLQFALTVSTLLTCLCLLFSQVHSWSTLRMPSTSRHSPPCHCQPSLFFIC